LDRGAFNLLGAFAPGFALPAGLTPSQVVFTARTAIAPDTGLPAALIAATPPLLGATQMQPTEDHHMRKPRNIIMRISSILALLLAFVAGRPVAAEEKPNFAIALCNWVGGAEVTEKVRGIYYNACICNEVDRTISRTGSAGNLWAEAEKLEGT